MNCAALIIGIREYFWYGFEHSEIFISDDQADSCQALFFQPYKEGTLVFLIFFHAFSCTNNLTAPIVADSNSNKDRNVLNFTTPTTFQIDTINIDIRIAVNQWACTSGFNMLICLFIEITDGSRGYFCFPQKLS